MLMRVRRLVLSVLVSLGALVFAGPASTQRLEIELPQAPALAALPPATAADRAYSYSWPLRPFDRQHAIRGGFGDPRFGFLQRNFHFGIDIPAPGGTPVYSVSSGTVFLEPDHVDVLTHVSGCCADGFSYWHIIPAVREHSFIAPFTLVGWVKERWAHLHFTELEHGLSVNPVRPGALTPYEDSTPPRVEELTLVPDGTAYDLTVEASVAPEPRPEPPWDDAVVAPSLIRWRLLENGEPVSQWRDAVDFRRFIPSNALFDDVYAPGTRANRPSAPGLYRYYLARAWDLSTLAPGAYEVEAQAFGLRGASATAFLDFTR
jgi:hypothetical protein